MNLSNCSVIKYLPFALFKRPFFTNASCPCQPISNQEKKKEIRLSPLTKPLYQQKSLKPKDNTQTPKSSLPQRLRTDLGRSVGVTSHPTAVVKPGLKGTDLPTHRKSSVMKSSIIRLKNNVYNTNKLSQRQKMHTC